MAELMANWTKVVIGIMAIIVTIGYATGHVSSDAWKEFIGAMIGVHAISSGGSSLIGKP